MTSRATKKLESVKEIFYSTGRNISIVFFIFFLANLMYPSVFQNYLRLDLFFYMVLGINSPVFVVYFYLEKRKKELSDKIFLIGFSSFLLFLITPYFEILENSKTIFLISSAYLLGISFLSGFLIRNGILK